MSNMPYHLSSFANQYFIRKMCVLITKGKDNKNLHDGGNEGISIRVWGNEGINELGFATRKTTNNAATHIS